MNLFQNRHAGLSSIPYGFWMRFATSKRGFAYQNDKRFWNGFMKSILFLLMLWLTSFILAESALALPPVKGGSGWAGPTTTSNLLKSLNVSWWYNWTANPVIFTEAARAAVPAVPHLKSSAFGKTPEELDQIVKTLIFDPLYPNAPRLGLYWLVGNEPDRCESPDSDGYFQRKIINTRCYPNYDYLKTEYAKLVNAVKTNDESAKIILGGLGRIHDHNTESTKAAAIFKNYWPASIRQKPLSSDIAGWHIHYYACCNWALAFNPPQDRQFEAQLRMWKTWQNANGAGETWLTEFGAQSNATKPPNDTSHDINYWLERYMEAVITLATRAQTEPGLAIFKLNRYSWFPLKPYGTAYPFALFNSTNQITNFGQKYASLGNPPFPSLQTFNRYLWYGSYPQNPNGTTLSNCKTISQNIRSFWQTAVRSFTPLPAPLTSLNYYTLSCPP